MAAASFDCSFKLPTSEQKGGEGGGSRLPLACRCSGGLCKMAWLGSRMRAWLGLWTALQNKGWLLGPEVGPRSGVTPARGNCWGPQRVSPGAQKEVPRPAGKCLGLSRSAGAS